MTVNEASFTDLSVAIFSVNLGVAIIISQIIRIVKDEDNKI